MFQSKKAIILYQLFLTLFATTVVLGVALRPAEGWLQRASALLQKWDTSAPTTAPFAKDPVNPQQLQYNLDAELDVKNSLIRGTATISIPFAPDDQLLFYLYPATFKPIQIEQVRLGGKTVSFDANAYHLTVPVKQKETPLTVQIRFATPIPATGTRLGVKDGVWSLTYWYPILAVRAKDGWIPRPTPYPFGDPYLMDLANYHVRLKYPADFKWYASGPLQTSVADGGSTMSEWTSNQVRNFALIGGTGWQDVRWKTAEGIDVTAAAQDASHLPELQSLARQAMQTYTQRFGNLTEPTLAVLEMPSGTTFAHEYSNLALYSIDIRSWSTGEHWIAHEIAHAWWFSAVGTYKAENPWLDEGLADYAAYLYEEEKYGHDAYKQAMARNWQLFQGGKSYAPHQFGAPVRVNELPLDLPYSRFSNEADYYYLMYLRPVLMYDDLRKQLGDAKFFAFLQQFYLKNMQTTATRKQLEAALREVSPEALPRLKLWLDAPNGELLQQVQNK